MNRTITGAILIAAAASAVWAQQANRPGRGPSPVLTMERPIDMHDTVWIEDMTLLEVRDSLKAGKTSVLIFAGGMEDNGPYITVSQHNSIVRAMCDLVARKLGNALCAPIVGLAPGSPERSASPGSVSITADTFKSILNDEATSLKAQGFKNVFFLADHGSDARPSEETAKALSEKWAGSGAAAYYVPEYYDNKGLEKFETDVLGVHEKTDGIHYHDDYPWAAVSIAIDPNGARMPERLKVKKTTVNGVELATPKAAEDGKKIMAFREDVTVKAIQKLLSPQ